MMIKNEKGFGKFEVLTVIVVLLCIFAYLMYNILWGADKQKFSAMKDNAIRVGNIASTNMSSFSNTETVYLDEIIDEGFLKEVKSPFESKYCDTSSSKVQLIDGNTISTLKCDDYIIENLVLSSVDDMKIYKVGKWSEKKSSDKDEEKKLYNCMKDGKEIYPDYMEELNMVYKVNRDNSTNYYFASDIKDTCQVVEKTFYRTKELVDS